MGALRVGRRPLASRVWRNAEGQSFAETVIALSLVMMFVLAIIYLSLLASTKHFVNYAAFTGARAAMYGGGAPWPTGGSLDGPAVRAVTSMINWGTTPENGETRDGYRVAYPTPLAYPLFNDPPGHIVKVYSIAPVARQPVIREEGDNAER